MNLPSASAVLQMRHGAFSLRQQRLRSATGPDLTAELTWPTFWDEIFRTLRSCGYRHSTCRQYRHVLRSLRDWGVKRPADLTASRARDFIARLGSSGMSWSWIALNIAVLRTVFDRLCGLSVTDGMVTPKRGFHLPELLSEEEAMRLVRAAGMIRDQLLLGLLYGCGLSGHEVCKLRWSDVLDNGARLHVAGSTRYIERVISVPSPFRELLRTGADTCEPGDYIFRGRSKGTALSARMVRVILRRACKSAGIERPLCVMSLRHSYAVRRLENALNLRELQQELGHASVRTTERYRHCLAPKVENHPFSKVRRLIALNTQSEEPACCRTGTADTRLMPLAGLETIPLRKLRLPFDPASGDSPAAAFLRFLTNRIYVGLIRKCRSRSP